MTPRVLAAHGDPKRYFQGCRCDPCRAANADYQRQWRAANRAAKRVPDKHSPTAYSNYGCRCENCVAAIKRKHNQEYTKRDPVEHRAHRINAQRLTLDQATRRGRQWTGPELEFVARTDLTTTEKALALGRTYAGVRKKIEQLAGGEPVSEWLAGDRSKLHG